MDMLDILFAKSLSSDSKADQAAERAEQAAEIASQSATQVETIVDSIPKVNITNQENNEVNTYNFNVNNDNITIKHYKQAGDNEDGTMTQKAIKDYVQQKQGIEGDKDSIVVIGEDGELNGGDITQSSIILTEIITGTYKPKMTCGIEIDYENKTCKRIQDCASWQMGEDFNEFPVYRGIKRCLVDDNGEIISFFGDDIYIDDYSTGFQTMVYIPKFYYLRIPVERNNAVIKKEIIMVSSIAQKGFKIHPAFINKNGEEIDYILYSAYEGCTFDVSANAYNRTDGNIDFNIDKLSSITDAKPISGVNNNLTRNNAEKLAQNRGQNWHITDIKIESAIQMLSIIEFGSLNCQQAIGKGISYIEGVFGSNCSSYTGSTRNLGNNSGMAASTINEIDGTEKTYTTNGYCAISYRGIENLWGNLRRFINGIEIKGNGSNGGIPYIYDEALTFAIPNNSDWISNFGYSENFDWAFIPIEASGANSVVPVGDYVDVISNLNGINVAALGGHWGFKENDGLFNYSFDRAPTYASRAYGARLMYIPIKNNIYEENIAAWTASMGG